MVDLIVNLYPTCSTFLQYDEERSPFFVVLFPPSTADVACPRFVHTNEPWRFQTMLRFSIVSVSARLMRLATIWMLTATFLNVFRQALPPFWLLLDFPCPLAYFSCVVGPYFLLGVLLPTTDVAAL